MSASHKQYVRRTLGFALISIGIFPLIIGIFIMNEPIYCPANGCDPGILLQRSLSGWIPFVSGIVLFVTGAVLIVQSNKSDPEKSG